MDGFDDRRNLDFLHFLHFWSAAANWVQLLSFCNLTLLNGEWEVQFFSFCAHFAEFKSVSYLIQFPTGGRPPLWVTVLWEWRSKHVARPNLWGVEHAHCCWNTSHTADIPLKSFSKAFPAGDLKFLWSESTSVWTGSQAESSWATQRTMNSDVRWLRNVTI